ncbi:MAG: nucleotidyltransferase domain-containing protein [Thermodesulfovibrionales bacterium]|nr:nucleotidyltransferase domain-containing protein [Thermodesulfovibrionales bacterium]
MRTTTLTEIFKKYDVRIAYLFGSRKDDGIAFLSGKDVKFDKEADLDIGVVFEKLPIKAFKIYGELYADLSILFEPFNIDLVFLQETDALFQYEAIKGALIYSYEESFLDDYEEMVMKLASDMAYKKIEFERDFLEAVRDGYFEIAHR